MNFIAKKTAYDELFGSTHIEADKQLMHKLAPQHNVLKKGVFDVNKYAADLLWTLLDFASRDEIVKNRRVVIAERTGAAAQATEEDKLAADEAAAGKKKASSKSKNTPK